ncbi:MAG: hypothetical protein IJM26_01330 [Lachnospiraceae bacterium]|nr:hypothetical protein [Lachnospiraceae bacterium]
MGNRCELPFFTVGEGIGGNQEHFSDWWMRTGGCGAVTACDLCIYAANELGLAALAPVAGAHVEEEDYLAFGMRMKKFLRPRTTGIDKTETYISGFEDYLESVGAQPFVFSSLSGQEDAEAAVRAVKAQIDRGLPVPELMLLHRDKKLDDYMWHWFLLTGYEEAGDRFLVKVVSYGREVWMDLRHLWRTGRRRKGGLVLIERREE